MKFEIKLNGSTCIPYEGVSSSNALMQYASDHCQDLEDDDEVVVLIREVGTEKWFTGTIEPSGRSRFFVHIYDKDYVTK